MYPKLVINYNKIKQNTKKLKEMLPVSIMGVTKVFCAQSDAVKAMIEGGVDYIADSRLENLRSISTDLEKVLLRIPMQSEIARVAEIADIVLISEIETIELLNKVASNINKTIKIILMIDLGDLREGIWFENEIDIERILALPNIDLFGIGTNLTCYGGIIPSQDHLSKLVEFKKDFEKRGANIKMISGGNSSSLHLDLSSVNNLRLGEVICLGRETAYGEIVDGLYDDCFTLEAEVIETSTKPSVPIGKIGMDAFGNRPEFEEEGNIERAILAVGRQDVDETGLIGPEVIGASSDHLIIKGNYKLGEIVKFKLTYGALLRLATSPYVKKEVKYD